MRISALSIENYRSLERLDLRIPGFYTAVSGRNNAGKTNLVRAIRCLMPDSGPMYVSANEEISFKEDYPIWKKPTEPIKVAVTFAVDPVTDAGLHTFIARIANLTDAAGSLDVTVQAERGVDATETTLSVQVAGNTLDEFSSTEIVKKLQSSAAVFFYNSTELDTGYRYRYNRGFGGTLGEFSPDDRAAFEKLQKKIVRFLTSVSKKHQKEISSLLGKLEEKYTVGITLPKMNLEHMPIDISLGGKSFSVPLND